MPTLRSMLLACVLGVGLTVIFWLTLWLGGGFVGGDVYSYYFPQKTLYAEGLRSGELPLWNPRTGHGYPLVGESQTGVFYPLHLLFYRVFEINTAYNAIHLLHYVLAFVFTVLYSRLFGLSLTAALFAGLVYTYGWFPSRCCVEWAIIGGAWFPAALCCVEAFLQARRMRYAIALSLVLTLQMLAGHFEIAFITQLTLIAYVPLRVWFAPRPSSAEKTIRKPRIAVVCMGALLLSYGVSAAQLLPTLELKQHSQRSSADDHELEFGAIPVWYWSQAVMPWHWYSPTVNRDALLQEHPPAFGARTNQVEAHLYFGMIPLALAAWGIVLVLRRAMGPAVKPSSASTLGSTELAEVPQPRPGREGGFDAVSMDRALLVWLLLGLAAFIYTTGWLLPITRHLPGFSFFQGPGRYGIVTTLAVALLGASGFDRLLAWRALSLGTAAFLFVMVAVALLSAWSLVSDVDLLVTQVHQANPLTSGEWTLTLSALSVVACVCAGICLIGVAAWAWIVGKSVRLAASGKVLSIGCLFAVTTLDLWIVGRLVTYSTLVQDPPIRHLVESPLREILAPVASSVRLYAPGPNLPNCLGVASTPPYLTFGPAAYVDPKTSMPTVADSPDDKVLKTSHEQLDWLRRAGVTHVLSFKPLDRATWPAELLWQGRDPFLNRAWGRLEPLLLYKLNFPAGTGSGRMRFDKAAPDQQATIAEYRLNRVVIEAASKEAGRLILTDLMYPGWTVTVDGIEAEPIEVENMYRAVDLAPGEHSIVWTYRPASLYWGAAISLIALVIAAAIAHIAYWHPERLRFIGRT
ncbi:MAG: YfhO family protein [Planctomycetaceae bacterium]